MKYIGQIYMHYEQSCGSWPQFHDKRGCHGPNSEFWSWNYTINFNWKTKIKKLIIWDEDGVLLYDDTFESIYMAQVDTLNRILSRNIILNCEIETDEILPVRRK